MDTEQLKRRFRPDIAGAAGMSADMLLARAKAVHEQGRFDEAERMYGAILADVHSHPEALHLSGVLQSQLGRHALAEVLLRRSVSLTPAALPLANLGSVLLSLGRRAEALQQFDAALAIDPRHLHALIRRGNTLVELARHEEALETYDRALEVAPTVIDALVNRGAALRALERHEEALDTYARALKVDPRSFEALYNLGNALRELGRYSEALENYERALAIVPNNVSLMSVRGMTLVDLDRLQEALASFNETVATQPDFVEGLYNSAVVLERLGRLDEAIVRCNRVLALEKMHAKALATRGNAQQKLERHADSLASYDLSLKIEPNAIDVLCNRGSLLRHLRRYHEALESYDTALKIEPEFTQALLNRANALQDLNRLDEALQSSDKLLAGSPDSAMAWYNRGNLLQQMGRSDDALVAYERAIALEPEYVEANAAHGFLLLSHGDFNKGWEEYEWRWHEPKLATQIRDFSQPRWLGKDSIAGKTILLHAEQGLGDTLQFCRYVDLVREAGARVVLEVQPSLTSLVRSLGDIDDVLARGEPLPSFDIHCPLLSLPLAFRTDLAAIPRRSPYLHADKERVAQWRAKLGTSQRLRVGLAWSGNPIHLNDENRSLPLPMLEPLFELDIEWVCLQKQVRSVEEEALAKLPIRRVDAELRDFSDTAALVECLDLVVSVDTSVAHLSGALGKPVWIMLPFPCDWRWMTNRDDSPWYPQARLFRQPRAKDWMPVIDTLGAALAARARQG